MTAASIWFVQHAAASAVEPLMQRSWDLACAFHLWFASRHAAICEMNMVVQVKSRVNNVFMASIVDAWYCATRDGSSAAFGGELDERGARCGSGPGCEDGLHTRDMSC